MDEWVDEICRRIAAVVPYPPLQDPGLSFLHRALVGLVLIAPLCSTIGIQVVNLRLAFFAEAVGHSAFTGLAIGLMILAFGGAAAPDPRIAMIVFGVAVAMAITVFRRRSGLSSDAVIGVFSSAVIALGLCLISRMIETNQVRGGGARLLDFLQGNILLVRPAELAALAAFFAAAMTYQAFAYNRLLFLGVNSALAATLGVRVRFYEYTFAALVALVVISSIQAVGVLLVTAMLVIPAAAARNLARSAGGMFWWGLVVAVSSAVLGLVLSDRYSTATGATTVLCTTAWFLASQAASWLKGRD